jgi:hypothetical protein
MPRYAGSSFRKTDDGATPECLLPRRMAQFAEVRHPNRDSQPECQGSTCERAPRPRPRTKANQEPRQHAEERTQAVARNGKGQGEDDHAVDQRADALLVREPPPDEAVPPPTFEAIEIVFAALSHEVRRHIVQLLSHLGGEVLSGYLASAPTPWTTTFEKSSANLASRPDANSACNTASCRTAAGARSNLERQAKRQVRQSPRHCR